MAKSPLLPQRVGSTLLVALDPAMLRNCREAAGLSQVTLAERIGVSESFVVQLERGAKKAALGTVTRLAEALEVEPVALCVTVPVTDPAGAA